MKNLPEKRNMIDKSDLKLSVSKQCRILGINRTSLYYKQKGECKLNLELMRLMDKHYLDHSFKGARRMHVWLTIDKGYKNVSLNRVSRLYYKVMALRAIAPYLEKAQEACYLPVFIEKFSYRAQKSSMVNRHYLYSSE